MIMQFFIQDDFWQLYPAAKIGIVVARGINNSLDINSTIEQALITATQAAALQIGEADFSTYPAIAIWREAYRLFGVKPAKFRSSIENLLRSAKGQGVRSINPLVDIYNTVSLRHMLPCGGEDIAAMAGDIHLTRAAGNELFIPLGSTEEQPPSAG